MVTPLRELPVLHRALERSRSLAASWPVFPASLFVFSRVALSGFSWMALKMVPELVHEGGPRYALLKDWPALDGFCRWDCGLYEKIARTGYTDVLDGNVWP